MCIMGATYLDISSCLENLSATATTCGISGWLQSQQSTFTSSIRSLDAFWWASFIMYTEILRNVHRNVYRFFFEKTFGFSLRACCSVTLWQHLTRRHWTLQKMFLTAQTRFIFVEVENLILMNSQKWWHSFRWNGPSLLLNNWSTWTPWAIFTSQLDSSKYGSVIRFCYHNIT